ncbi:MAG: histidine ammonia-lyase, partial [Tistrella sp.]|nr:histidine ammonia-lyase [Tistrella sp.]
MTETTETLVLAPGRIPLDDLRRIWAGRPHLALDDAAPARMAASAAIVERIAAGEEAVYGINTGFGQLAQKRIA